MYLSYILFKKKEKNDPFVRENRKAFIAIQSRFQMIYLQFSYSLANLKDYNLTYDYNFIHIHMFGTIAGGNVLA